LHKPEQHVPPKPEQRVPVLPEQAVPVCRVCTGAMCATF